MPQLDGLRAFAVIAVAVSHWTPGFLAGIVPWGTGVQLFFVLSGFLITGILLRSRPADLGIPITAALKVFYIRRILRIFPLYYGVLGLSLLLAIGPIYSTWPWHFSYLSNIYYAWHGHGDAIADPFLHLWSLSVEEQFYLLWPFIALVLSRRSLLVFLCVCIVGSTAFRVSAAHFVPALASVRYLTPSCLDALAVGGLLAHARHYEGSVGVRHLARRLGWIGAIGLIVCVLLLGRVIHPADAHRVGHTFLVIFYGFIVGWAADGFGGVAGRILSFQPVLYLGRISYGVYVFHYFAPVILSVITGQPRVNAGLQLPAALLAYSVITLTLAVVSWHLYELPINRLKRHFQYPRAHSSPPRPDVIPSPVSNI